MHNWASFRKKWEQGKTGSDRFIGSMQKKLSTFFAFFLPPVGSPCAHRLQEAFQELLRGLVELARVRNPVLHTFA
ncbi:MAG: hypothetical protein ACI4QS_05325, partial [Comamonas sp.]